MKAKEPIPRTGFRSFVRATVEQFGRWFLKSVAVFVVLDEPERPAAKHQ